jgi:hypothetical protein
MSRCFKPSCFFKLSCALLVLLCACSEGDVPLTQIVVVVDSDFSGLTRFEAEVVGFEEPTTVKADLVDEPLPRRFSLVHDGGSLGPMAVTVRAYTDDGDEPILVEPRTKMFFEPGRTLLLKIDLLAACVALDCPDACVAPGECVSSDDAAVLVPWTGDPDELGVGGPLDAGMDGGPDMKPDGSMEEGGVTMDSGMDAEPPLDGEVPDTGEPDTGEPDANEPDAELDSGQDTSVPEPTWPYVPGNVDVSDDGPLADLTRSDVLLDCDSTIDSTTPSTTGFCNGEPDMVFFEQPGGGEVLVVVMSSLQIDAGSTLYLTGTRPIVLLVEGDATISGTIDASAAGTMSGAGADDAVCAASVGVTGNDGSTSNIAGATGGGGGGFGTPGTASGSSNATNSVAGGMAGGEPTLVPLRGGCRGGAGGFKGTSGTRAAYGGGGGAMQLSVAGTLTLTGVLRAAGGGGAPGAAAQGGGGGGGSGGAILIEAQTLAIDPAAVIAANGGAGGGGQALTTLDSTPGGDGNPSTTPATGGNGASSGGDGGRGSALGSPPTSGGTGALGGTCFPAQINCHYGGSGGGAGGVGRIRVRGATSCALPGIFSPLPSVACESCTEACAPAPDLSCLQRVLGDSLYYVCSGAQTWNDARMLCQASSLDLVKVESELEDDFLFSQSPTDTWIGAYDLNDDDDWRWSVDDSAFWSGDEDGDPVGTAYDGWRSGNEPNGSGDCGRITADGWADADCDDTLPFICE